MAKIKNLTNQLQVVGSKGLFLDTINFYNKRDLDENVILGVKAINGDVVLFRVSNGKELGVIETFDYSNITSPVSASIEDLIEQINTFLTNELVSVTQIIGGVTLSSSSNTNILNGTYVILADTTAVSSVTSGVGQDSNWTLEVTQAGITNQKGVVAFTGNLEKDAGGGKNYDIAIFKNGSIVSESEQIDQKLESDGKGQSVTVMAIIEFSTNDTFDVRVAGNGTAEDIFCGGGSLYIQ